MDSIRIARSQYANVVSIFSLFLIATTTAAVHHFIKILNRIFVFRKCVIVPLKLLLHLTSSHIVATGNYKISNHFSEMDRC